MTNQTNEINYGWQNDFIAQPAPGAVEKDLTKTPLILDMQNTKGETFHWEVLPGDTADHLPSRPSNSAADKNGKVFVLMTTQPFYHPSVRVR